MQIKSSSVRELESEDNDDDAGSIIEIEFLKVGETNRSLQFRNLSSFVLLNYWTH